MTKKLTKKEYEVYKKYGIHGTSRFAKRPINYVKVNASNSLEHETAKLVVAYERIKEGHKIITEALEKSTGLIRDVVDLTTGEAIELETNKQRAKRHKKEIEIMKVII